MFALHYLYMCGLGIWLGSLITVRYIVPAASIRRTRDRVSASDFTAAAIQAGNKLGFACGIGMVGSLILQTLLSATFSWEPEILLLISCMIVIVPLVEMTIRDYRNRLSKDGTHFRTDASPVTPKDAGSLIPRGARLLILVQIFIAFVILFLSLY